MLTNSQLLTPDPQAHRFGSLGIWSLVIIWLLVLGHWDLSCLYAQEKKSEPIIVNGDVVEYSPDSKKVTATGNVSVTYKDATLTSQKITVDIDTKDGTAEGNARLEDKRGVIEGTKIIYNFNSKKGLIIDADFRSNPYFGKSDKVDKVSDAEFIIRRGYMTTCSYDNPHYRIKSRKIDFFPGDKVQTKEDTVYVGRVPLFYLPQYNHSLKDPLMHVQLMPGKRKDWGMYMLSAWRYSLAENIKGRIYLDYREKLGVAEGFGTNYKSSGFGKGDFKFYYTQERDKSGDVPKPEDDPNFPRVYQRYFTRWRHQWDIDERTNLTSEYYKIVDSKRFVPVPNTTYNILKDYFTREYEKNSQPLTYALLHHTFNYANMDILLQKRTNRWYTQLEKLPEIKYSLPGFQIGESPFYFENNTQAANFNYKYAVPSDSSNDIDVMRLDTSNKFYLPTRVAFIQLAPFVKSQETYYNKNVYGSSTVLRTIFYTGVDASTKFYRIFNVKSNFLKLDINGLRHIITPTATYSYNHEPTISSSKLRQIDGTDSINQSNSVSLALSNKLQTKRNNQSVDFADFRVGTNYIFKPKSGDKRGSNLSDIIYELDLLPYSWLRVDANTTYKRSGNRSDVNYHHFSNANYDINFNWAQERSFGLGQRYQRKGGNAITYNLKWRLNPKWKFLLYHSRERGHDPALKRGLREQEYTLARDLHCWTVEMTYNIKRSSGYASGESIWFVFRLKAFPELEFEFNRSYHAPKSGSQSNP
jgi:lipopolysaccharide assembly outer membrane protein LptD (OstA)